MAKTIIKLKNLDKLRRLYNMSAEELMDKIGKDRTTYYMWQKKGAIPSIYVVELHKIFNVSTDLLLDVKPLIIEESA
ncbi:MAG: helix-turn-helix domain-containing protein [Ruminococcus sp.]|nr:helix-turn-helix domain-containing protein [Ruminococcus sp.]